MTNYLSADSALQVLLTHHLPLSPAQTSRIAQLCLAILLAGRVHLTWIARMLTRGGKQDSRVRWIQRLLQAPFLSADYVYAPLLRHALQGFSDPTWHLVLDRTRLDGTRYDLATLSVNYRHRAVPLVWCLVPFGGAADSTYTALVRRGAAFVPPQVSVVLHGDTEFTSARMVKTLRELGWDFMLAAQANHQFRCAGDTHNRTFGSLPVTRSRSCQLANIELFASQRFSGLNLLAFYQPKHNGPQRKRTVRYIVTSLPLTRGIRRLGRRRWGTEPFYRDYKSSGWQMTTSKLSTVRFAGLLILLAVLYLWTVCFGSWLCKRGRRQEVDSKRQRHLSLFRIGWDWLVYHLRCNVPIPILLRLYA